MDFSQVNWASVYWIGVVIMIVPSIGYTFVRGFNVIHFIENMACVVFWPIFIPILILTLILKFVKYVMGFE